MGLLVQAQHSTGEDVEIKVMKWVTHAKHCGALHPFSYLVSTALPWCLLLIMNKWGLERLC